jgi:hypothetical protein
MTGIDISHHQKTFPDGDWEFVVVKATEGASHVDPKLDKYWDAASRFPRRGAYHYARPNDARDGPEEAAFFQRTMLARGFRPGVDMWQLDVEGKRNEGVAPGTWRTFIADFMEAALRDLGAFGFLYIGFPFYRGIYGASDLDPLRQFNWWLPAYGKNDGAVHAFRSNVPSELVVIHQFTSAGHLDRNRVVDQRKWATLNGATSAATPAIDEEVIDMRLIPRRALAHPKFAGRVGYIKFDPASKTLTSFNGIDFDRNQDPKVWKIVEGFGVVAAQLQLPARGPLSYSESPDGSAVIVTDDRDGGTFALPYRELAHD